MTRSNGFARRPAGARLIPLLCLLGSGSLLGIRVNLAKFAAEAGLSPLAFLSWSIVGASLILLAVSALRRDPPPVSGRTLEYYAVSALVAVAGFNLISFSVIPHVGASFVSLILTASPLLTYIGALMFRMERFHSIRAVGVAAALAGTGVLALGQLSAPDANPFWILLALVGPVLLAIGNLYRTLRWPQGAAADELAPGMLVASSVMLLGAGLIPGFSLAVPLGRSLPLMLIAVQAVVFAGMYLLLLLLQKTGGPVLLSLQGSVGAVVSVPVAIFLQNEAPPKGLALGVVLTASGIALVTLGQARSREKKTTNER